MITVVQENSAWIMVDKPAGWLSVPSRLGKADSRPCLGKLLEVQLNQRLYPVHRLDAEASGWIIFAKTPEAQLQLTQRLTNHLWEKTYTAWTEVPKDPAALPPLGILQEWQSLLAIGKKRTYDHPQGKPSTTLATLIEVRLDGEDAPMAIWTLTPKTGRRHQLRYELSKRGFPILGDLRYGAIGPCPKSFFDHPETAIALRCSQLKP